MKLSGKEIIEKIDKNVLNFWSWAYSDILSNRNRSIFAEFLVAVALDKIQVPRIEWDAVDLRYDGKRIEVKSAAYVQSWKQEKYSAIRFDIGRKKGWDAKLNTFSNESIRNADCYVFCLFTEQNQDQVNILNVEKWLFYIANTQQLESNFGNQKSVGFNRLRDICTEAKFDKLKAVIDKVLI